MLRSRGVLFYFSRLPGTRGRSCHLGGCPGYPDRACLDTNAARIDWIREFHPRTMVGPGGQSRKKPLVDDAC